MKIKIIRPMFPFTAIIEQENIKLSLLLNVIDQKIGGVIVIGDRGTGKSTRVRSLVNLLPIIEVVLQDSFQSHPIDPNLISFEVCQRKRTGENFFTELQKIPIIDLPLGATEDRVCGTIDIELALREGVKSFEPGILARANRGVLYVDEVNLLDDHLIDIILDAAASGWNTVEREGISLAHPSQFILVGSGNPEEGELRPQLLDRFGIHAKIITTHNPIKRVDIVEHCTKFDLVPNEFCQIYESVQVNLCNRIYYATIILAQIKLTYNFRVRISKLCSILSIDGLRGDIVLNRSIRATTAFEKHLIFTESVQKIGILCLIHRMRKDPLERRDFEYKVKIILFYVFA